MEQREEIILMLNQIPNPAFLVKDGSILEVNPSAAVQMIPVGAQVQELLATGQQEYSDYAVPAQPMPWIAVRHRRPPDP